jgi:hypothetical protein
MVPFRKLRTEPSSLEITMPVMRAVAHFAVRSQEPANDRFGPILLKKSQVEARRKSAQIAPTSEIDDRWPRNSI